MSTVDRPAADMTRDTTSEVGGWSLKSIGMVFVAALLLAGCSHVGMLGFELEIRADEVLLRPVTEELHEQCAPEHANMNSC